MAPAISAVICTRNRGSSCTLPVASVLSNTHPNFEVIVVDQSTDTRTRDAVQTFSRDPRFTYTHSTKIGTGYGRNVGLEKAQGKVVAFVDDDCQVPPEWLEKIEAVFADNPKVGMMYCQVTPASYNPEDGYIPDYVIPQSRMLQKIKDCISDGLGIGAGMAVRKAEICQIGGFDGRLGPGSFFKSAEDRDMAIRVILKGYWVYAAAEIAVVHYGFRKHSEGKEHTKRTFVGLGATFIKPVKCGYWQAAPLLFTRPLWISFFKPFLRLAQFKRPHGLRKPVYYCLGIVRGLLTPVDRKHILYLVD